MSSLLTAMRPLAWDFLPTIIFAGLTAMHVDVQMATVAAVGVGVAQVLAVKAMGHPVALLQWAGLGLAVVFGGASVLTQDPRFIMAKPTIIYFAIAAVMLKRGWMLRYLPAIARGRAEHLMIGWGYAWAGMMAFTGLANAAIALWLPGQWPLFIALFPLPSKLILFALQYASVRHIVRGQMIREAQAQAQAQAA